MVEVFLSGLVIGVLLGVTGMSSILSARAAHRPQPVDPSPYNQNQKGRVLHVVPYSQRKVRNDH